MVALLVATTAGLSDEKKVVWKVVWKVVERVGKWEGIPVVALVA